METHSQSLRRKLKDLKNGLSESTEPKPKRSKTTRTRNTNDEEDPTELDQFEHFIIQAGHKFCITCGPWLHSGAMIFRLDLDESYNPAERAENEENKCQAQLREIWELLQAKFELQDLKQAWVAKAASLLSILYNYCSQDLRADQGCYFYPVREWH